MSHHLELLATLYVQKNEVTKAGEQKASSWLIRGFNQPAVGVGTKMSARLLKKNIRG